MSPTEQRFEALKMANEVRLGGAALKRELMAGDISLADALEDPRAQFVQVGQLLCAQRGWGPTKANKLLNSHRIYPTRRVRHLTPRQRRVVGSVSRPVERAEVAA